MFRLFFVIVTLLFPSAQSIAIEFNSGSNGSFGAILIEEDTVIDLPPDGIIHATTITINPETRLEFKRNELNTPVYLLATGDIIIDGEISISANGRLGGPGGFDGGMKYNSETLSSGAGYGPGAGLGGSSYEGGNAGFKVRASHYYSPSNSYVFGPLDGKAYGNTLLVPIIGGSGGGGSTSGEGGGGGGAIVVASNTAIIFDKAGNGLSLGYGNTRGVGVIKTFTSRTTGAGSGGAVRLVAPSVIGEGYIGDTGVFIDSFSNGPSEGRSRIDVINRLDVQTRADSIGSFMQVFPPVNSRLDIIEVAGNNIPEGTSNEFVVTLPINTPTQQTIIVQGRDFVGTVPVRIVVTPDTGEPIVTDTQLDMSSGTPATVTIDVDLPQNIPMLVHAWTM